MTSSNFGPTDFLRVSAARREQSFRPPRINEMTDEQVKQLTSGHTVFAFTGTLKSTNSQLIIPQPIPLKALAVISPVFNVALMTHNRNNNRRVNNIVLPTGEIRAYREILLWILDVVNAGKMVSMRDLRDRPLTCYNEVIWIANRLRISYLAAGLRRRVNSLLTVKDGKPFSIHPGDIKDAYYRLPKGHWLIEKIVSAVAAAEEKDCLHSSFRSALGELYGRNGDFAMDVQQKRAKMHYEMK